MSGMHDSPRWAEAPSVASNGLIIWTVLSTVKAGSEITSESSPDARVDADTHWLVLFHIPLSGGQE